MDHTEESVDTDGQACSSSAKFEENASDSVESELFESQAGPREDDQNESAPQKKGCLRCLSNVTVEPIILLTVLSFTIQTVFTTNLMLAKVCEIHFNYSEEICNNLTFYKEKQENVQKLSNTYSMYKDLLENIPAVLFALFMGSWSDSYGRKIPMLLPIFGYFFSALVYMFNSYVWYLSPEYIILAGIPRALSGSFATLLMASYSYIADLTKLQSRTMRIAFMDAMMFVGAPVGLFISKPIFEKLGYIGIYGIAGGLHFICIIYIIVRIEDTRGPLSRYRLESRELSEKSGNMCTNLFDVKNVKETFVTTVKWRENRGRSKILLLMFALCLLVICFSSGGLDYLYTVAKFNWNYSQFINLSIFNIVFGIIGTAIVLPLLSYKLKVDDGILGLAGCVSRMVGFIVYGLAPTPAFIYLAGIISCVGSLPTILTRSIISKIVPQSELGKVFSMLGAWESVIPLFASPLYTAVYNATLHDFPGTYALFSASFVAVALVIYIWFVAVRAYEMRYRDLMEESITEIPA
ncbi:putative peptidoglycan muropeptide transporter SLC46 [Oratosquilla oratoria]|uniref:putative peptidoglycan muropeptide transporter SLC46 n=1 Tax=Oratosquilla oratoria TaxID=337810 RepID=UPI003F7690EA